ncbi:MAG: alpha-amylase family glycosyl hydrolase [Myxococcaceae bacterium]
MGLIAAACAQPDGPADVLATETRSLYSSSRAGMGATVYPGGVTFRVWAPFARRVWVSGDFNGWGRTELGNEFNGYFSCDVDYAGKHQKFRYLIENEFGGQQWRSDPRAQRMTASNGDSVIHDPASYGWNSGNFGTPGFADQVIYELHVGTFHDSPGYGPGTWQSAVAKLDYLRELGINMVEVMPVFEFPGDFSWGYNPSAPFAPESAYGSPDDMKYFIDQAHLRGIGVIFDVVHNHYGPSDLPLWCFSGNCIGNGGEYFFSDERANTPWGNTRPDYGRPEVRQYIRDHSMMLLHEYRADGLRFDATKFMRTIDGNERRQIPQAWELFKSLNDEVNATQPWKRMIAEDFGAGAAVTSPTFNGGAGFDAQWVGDFVHPVRRAITVHNDSDRNLYEVRDALTQRFNGNAFERIIYTESHDEVANGRQRLPEEIWPGNSGSWVSKKRSTLGAALTMTAPGTPLIFQGQEFVEDGYFQAEDPLDWSKAGYFAGITQLYRDLIKLRRNWSNNTRGLQGQGLSVHHVNNDGKVLAYHRWKDGGPGDDVVVVANFSGNYYPNYRVGFPHGGMWWLRFNSDYNGYSPDFGNTATLDTAASGSGADGLIASGNIALGPYSVVIFSQ